MFQYGSIICSSREISHKLFEVMSSAIFIEGASALRTNLKMETRTELVWNSISYLDPLGSHAGSTEVMAGSAAVDREILLEPFQTDLTTYF